MKMTKIKTDYFAELLNAVTVGDYISEQGAGRLLNISGFS